MNIQDERTLDAEHTELDQGIPEPVSQLPWYLQVETPQHELRSLSERQQLPELPPDPPPLLQPILEHISIDLGLDDLSLFDLRKLNPPPALGANLLVILGTARSEKHLHVSANRFCRWLRSAHKLTPYADGLMGRGELKLKMRRKARRARILSRVGSSERYSQDDGLTTGWICVNVGTIEDGKEASEEILEPEGFVGFGEEFGGAKVVIQMLTEEKRIELDMEELWEDMLKSHRRKEAKIKDSREAAINDGPSDYDSLQEQTLSSNSSSVVLSKDQKPSGGNYQQRREIHNSALHRDPQPPGLRSVRGKNTNRKPNPQTPRVRYRRGNSREIQPNPQPPGLRSVREKNRKRQSNPQSRGLRFVKFSRNMKRRSSTKPPDLRFELIGLERTAGNSESTGAVLDKNLLNLRASLDYLRSLSTEDALKALGTGITDWSSTSFLASFYRSYPLFPQEDHWECRFTLVCFAIGIGHPGYNKRDLMVLVDQMRTTIVDVPSSFALKIIGTLLSRDAPAQSSESPRMGYSFGVRDYQDSLTILDLVHSQDVDIHLKKILTTLYAATAYASASNFPLEFKWNVNFHLRLYLDDFDIEPMDTETHLTVLNILAHKDSWEAFWAHWIGISRRMQHKPAELYASMFHLVAETRKQNHCIEVLRSFVPEMRLEEPPVRLEGEVAKAVMECLRIVAPGIEARLRTWQIDSQWLMLWRRCELSIRYYTISKNEGHKRDEGTESDHDPVPSY